MDNPALTQKLKGLLLCGAGLVLAVLLAGTFPILGGAFTPFQILMAIGVVKFLIGDVALRRTRFRIGNRFDAFLIAGFMGILTWHGVHDRFGMRFLGSTVWGGHNYVNVYIGLIAFFVVQSIPAPAKIWSKLPYVVLIVTSFDLLIALITTIFPRSIYVIYPFYSAVSTTALEEAITGTSLDLTGRIGAFGNFGFVLILIILASHRITKIVQPGNFFRLVCLAAGCIATLFSGFRSAVINVVIGFLVAGIRDLKFAAVLLLPFFAIVLFALSAINSEFVHLPKQIQRGLAFLPGEWDADMMRSATASNDFRQRIWTIWRKDYFPSQPWLGRGFGFKSDWGKNYYSTAVDYRQMVETGNLHNGLFAAVDTFGIVGTVFFVIWNLRLLVQTFRVPLRTTDPSGITSRFVALYLGVWIISYWFGSSSVGSFLPLEFALAGVFLRLQGDLHSGTVPVRPGVSTPPNLREEVVSA